jgi:hypothetical protein
MQAATERDVLDIVGISQTEMTIRTNLDLPAIVLELPAGNVQMLLSTHAATDLILRLISAITRINNYGGADDDYDG